MTEIARSFLIFLAVGFSVALDNYIKGVTDLDLSVIARLTKYFHPQSVVVVKDREDVSLLSYIKTFSRVYCTVVNSRLLERILDDKQTQLSFLERKTLILTEEELNLTSLLSKVSAPHFVTWAVLRDYTRFQDLYISVSSQVIFINSSSAMRVYHLEPGSKERIKNIDMTQFSYRSEKINFEKIRMKMQSLITEEVCAHVHRYELLRKLECIHRDFLQLIGERLNISITVVMVQEKEHAFTFPNGSDSEVYLKLKYREVDFSSISHVIHSRSNRSYIQFVWPTFTLKSRMYLKQGKLDGRWGSYLRPLESTVWWVILIWIAATGILIEMAEKLLSDKIQFDFSLILDFVTSILRALQVFCNQALTDIPASYSIRIIYFLKFFLVLIFIQVYCGYLVSSLTVIVPRFPFKDLEGFFENHQYRVMTLQRGFHHYYFNRVAGEGQRGNYMLPRQELPTTVQEAVDVLCKQRYFTYADFRENLLNFDKLNCKILELPHPNARLHVGIAMPSGTPLKEYFTRELLLLRTAGLARRLEAHLSSRLSSRKEYGAETEEEVTTVSMAQIFSVFFFLGMGLVVSVVVLVVEMSVEKMRKLFVAVFRRKVSRNSQRFHPATKTGHFK